MDIENQINRAVDTLNKGGVIIIPTETLYGIIADATNNLAVERIYEVKSRDYTKPLQIFLEDKKDAVKYGIFGNNAKATLEDKCPGPITIIVKLNENSDLSASFNKVNKTIGIRIPDSEIASKILQKFGKPIAATSANLSGDKLPPTCVENIHISVRKSCDFIIDAGEIINGTASEVVDFTDDSHPKIIRKGVNSA